MARPWLADGDHLDELRQRAFRRSYYAPRELLGRLADHDMLDELWQRAASGSYHAGRLLARRLAALDLLGELRQRASARDDYALRALAWALAERGRHAQLRNLARAANPDRRLLILDAAAGANMAGLRELRVQRVLAGLGSKVGRAGLARRLAREGRLDELRERAESGDVYAQAELSGQPG